MGKLYEARRIVGRIQDFQRVEAEGSSVPLPNLREEAERKAKEKEAKTERKRRRRLELEIATQRRKSGGVIGEMEAIIGLKRTASSMLAHAGFEGKFQLSSLTSVCPKVYDHAGANEIALDIFTRIAIDHLRNLGRTLRLLVDGFGSKMTPEVCSTELFVYAYGCIDDFVQEIMLHALHENGEISPSSLEAHVKDDIERESVKIAEMTRKIRQSYKEVVRFGTVSLIVIDHLLDHGTND